MVISERPKTETTGGEARVNMNKLRAKIVEAGLTQAELAKACKISRATLNRKINGHVPFDAEEILSICRALRIVDNDEKIEIFLT